MIFPVRYYAPRYSIQSILGYGYPYSETKIYYNIKVIIYRLFHH